MKAAVSAPRPVRVEPLTAAITEIFAAAGLCAADSAIVAEALVDADLRGVESHGVVRVPIYLARLARGLVRRQPGITVLRDRGGALLIDGGNGMGQVVMRRAMDLALERGRDHASVSIAVRRSNHYGAGAWYARRVAESGFAVWIYGNAPSTMSPWGGAQRYLGTNPYTFALPARHRPTVVLDMATSVVARGRIIFAQQQGEPIPAGWAITREGEPTTDADAALTGSVLPFGGAKGYGIAFMIEAMAAAVSGAAIGPAIGDLYEDFSKPQDVGAFIQVVRLDAFESIDAVLSRIDSLIDGLKAIPPGPGSKEVLVPGELEHRRSEAQVRDGVVLAPATVRSLIVAAEALDVDEGYMAPLRRLLETA